MLLPPRQALSARLPTLLFFFATFTGHDLATIFSSYLEDHCLDRGVFLPPSQEWNGYNQPAHSLLQRCGDSSRVTVPRKSFSRNPSSRSSAKVLSHACQGRKKHSFSGVAERH